VEGIAHAAARARHLTEGSYPATGVLPGNPRNPGKRLAVTASMARRCCNQQAANDNDGSEMLSPQQRRANDAVPPRPANDNNGSPMLRSRVISASPALTCPRFVPKITAVDQNEVEPGIKAIGGPLIKAFVAKAGLVHTFLAKCQSGDF
jgi:hypothetical protein